MADIGVLFPSSVVAARPRARRARARLEHMRKVRAFGVTAPAFLPVAQTPVRIYQDHGIR